MQQRRSCKSERESVLRARQRSLSCLRRRWYSSLIRFFCSRWLVHGHFIRHWSGPHDTFISLAPCSLIHGSTRLWINSIAERFELTFFWIQKMKSKVQCNVMKLLLFKKMNCVGLRLDLILKKRLS